MKNRNYDNIQFAELRQNIEQKYNNLHDELSSCYYGKKPFRDMGILDKETFDKLHGLIFLELEVEFHDAHESLSQEKKYQKYSKSATDLLETKNKIAELKSEKLDVKCLLE